MASYAEVEDAVLSSVLAVQLEGTSRPTCRTPVIALPEVVKELAGDAHAGQGPFLLARQHLEMVLVDRLITNPPPDYPQSPFDYLLACYTRAVDATRTGFPSAHLAEITVTLTELRALLVSYAGLTLITGIVPQPEEAAAFGPLQFVHSLCAHVQASMPGSSMGPGSVPMTAVAMLPWFLESFCAQFEGEGLDTVLEPCLNKLADWISGVSLLGDFVTPLTVLQQLVACKPAARTLTASSKWLGSMSSGRSFQLQTLLGPFFGIGGIPDDGGLQRRLPEPDLRTTCFSNMDTKGAGDLNRSCDMIRAALKQVGTALFTVVKTLLAKDTRAAMLAWLAAALTTSGERAKHTHNPNRVASHNFMLNVSSVLVQLCEPFLDPSTGKAWSHIDSRYVTLSPRIDWKSVTKVAVDEAGDQAAREEVLAALNGQTVTYHFVCECFFLGVHSLHLGLVQAIAYVDAYRQNHIPHANRLVQELEAEGLDRAHPAMEQARTHLNRHSATHMCFTATLNRDALEGALGLYRLLGCWLMRAACPVFSKTGQPHLPLQAPSTAFATLPETFVEDIATVLEFCAKSMPDMLDGLPFLNDILAFCTVFMGSASHVRNPYIRSQLMTVLYCLTPEQQSRRVPGRPQQQWSSKIMMLLETDPVLAQHLMPMLLELYVDIEFTDRHNAFYEKFERREQMGDLMASLWELPSHRAAWIGVATADAGRGLYLRFANMLINDAIFMLDDCLKKLETARDTERLQANAVAWEALSAEDRTQRTTEVEQHMGSVRDLLRKSKKVIHLVSFSTGEPRLAAPFLLEEMVQRIAAMLNYFLLYLTGPERKRLAIKDKEKYSFKPLELLTEIIGVYLHLDAADADGVFPPAVATDARSYRPNMFQEALHILTQHVSTTALPSPSFLASLRSARRAVVLHRTTMPRGWCAQNMLDQLEVDGILSLGSAARRAAEAAAAEDELLEDPPDEFTDPISCTLMRDPVMLPTSRTVLDRSVIARHLLTDPRDPINRAPLKIEDVVPAVELKGRIDAWIAEVRAAAASGKRAASAAGDDMEVE